MFHTFPAFARPPRVRPASTFVASRQGPPSPPPVTVDTRLKVAGNREVPREAEVKEGFSVSREKVRVGGEEKVRVFRDIFLGTSTTTRKSAACQVTTG